jgi:sulfite reductase alpha subunit-like flavoprotein
MLESNPIFPESDTTASHSPNSSSESLPWSDNDSITAPSTPHTELPVDEVFDEENYLNSHTKQRRASTTLLSQHGEDIRRILGDGEIGTQLIRKYCCGGGCCLLQALPPDTPSIDQVPVELPDNAAFKSLKLNLAPLSLDTELTDILSLPETIVSFDAIPSSTPKHITTVHTHPPTFVQPHPPYGVFSAPLHHARELTKPGAEKRTFHFDIDVTDYPDEGGVDFKVGGAIGVCPPNETSVVDEIFTLLGVPSFARDKQVLLRTTGGRWPTIWGEEKPRELITTRRELLTWCTDVQSKPPTKPLLRVLAEHASAPNEKKILLYLVSAQGQANFCDLRTGPHLTLTQLLNAFPSSKPPLPTLFSVLPQLMPRFYSLSNDPHISSSRDGLGGRRLVEMAVTIHETCDWSAGTRTGVGSGFLERVAQQFIQVEAEKATKPKLNGESSHQQDNDTQSPLPTEALNLRIPIFRGLMANPLSREFVSDGPMMLIGAGVGMAPFRGFILNRLKNANCANKIWLVQGVRDSSLDEIYSGELGSHERDIKHVVQSRKARVDKGEAKYVQDEVRHQADVVWYVVNAVDGRVFVCGSSQGMGEGVRQALIDVAMTKGGLNREQAEQFWEKKREDGQYIEVCYFPDDKCCDIHH